MPESVEGVQGEDIAPAREVRFRAVPFTASNLKAVIAESSGGDVSRASVQAEYLATTYLPGLREHRNKYLLIETPYVDRHFSQEYVGYYSTTLHPPASHTTRIHVFARDLGENRWRDTLERAHADAEGIQNELGQDYLGYIVVRPVADSPIGRTLLEHYEVTDANGRHYEPAATRHAVHVAGLTLHVCALPFQQQDKGLGACATTALWSALARVMRADGARAVTPLDVNHAAVGDHGRVGSALASRGLNIEEMVRAIRACGYASDVVNAHKCSGDEFFLSALTYLRSGIPVVLIYQVGPEANREMHAATVAGFRTTDSHGTSLTKLVTNARSPVNGLLEKLYVHDDRLGPYARLVPIEPDREAMATAKKHAVPPPVRATFSPGNSHAFKAFGIPVDISSALIPLYPKLRLTASDLLAFAVQCAPVVSRIGGLASGVTFASWFVLGGGYLAHLPSDIEPKKAVEIRSRAFLSRYVGVLRFWFDRAWLADTVLDGTDVARPESGVVPALLIACRDAAANALFQKARDGGMFPRGTLIV